MTPNNPTIPAKGYPPNSPQHWVRMASTWQVMVYVTMITNVLTAIISAAYGQTPVMMVALGSCILMVLYLFLTFVIDKKDLTGYPEGDLAIFRGYAKVAAGIGYCAMLVSMGASVALLVVILWR